MLALRTRLGPEVELVGVERQMTTFLASLETDPRVGTVAADLSRPLPFGDASFEAAVTTRSSACLISGRSCTKWLESWCLVGICCSATRTGTQWSSMRRTST